MCLTVAGGCVSRWVQATLLADAYETVYSAVHNPANGYEDASAVLKHTPAEMRTICAGL